VGSGLRSVPARVRWLAALLLTLFVLQASWASRRDSVTIDEFLHLPVGLYTLYTGDFSIDPINPPLTRMLAAVPVAVRAPAFRARADLGGWGLGYAFMRENAADYQRLFVAARGVVIALGALLGLLVFVWANALYGWPSALTAVFLFSFSPSMLTHAHLVTLDEAGALGFVATVYAAWRFLERPTATRALLTGVALGVATLLKLSGFVLIGVVVALVLIRMAEERLRKPGLREGWRDRKPTRAIRWLGLMALLGLASLAVLNLGYGFQGTFAPLTSARLADGGALAALRNALPWLRLPLPLAFINGVDMVMNVGKGHDPSYFLAGELSAEGWWYYHLAAFLFKTPLPLVFTAIAALVLWAIGRDDGARSYCLYVPVLFVFAANSLFNSLDIGVRHVLAVYPLLFVAVAPLLARPIYAWTQANSAGRAPTARAAVALALLMWFFVGGLRVAPAYFEYFNELAGGPQGGYRMLIDSNLDWGQDLIRLRELMDRRGYERVNLAYFGRVDPAVYGVEFVPLEGPEQKGPTVVSASFLMGRPYFWIRRGRMRWIKPETYAWLQKETPVARAGTMFVYER